jgi:monoamine oxidase
LPLVKAAMLYKSPFWRADGLNGAMQSDRSPIQLVFDNSPEDASMGVLSCFLSVVECPHLADRKAREDGLRDELARYFGPKALDATGYVEKDWSADPWSTGCITPLTPGVLTAGGEHLRKPAGRILAGFFGQAPRAPSVGAATWTGRSRRVRGPQTKSTPR